jgi:YD repeat-containing protein
LTITNGKGRRTGMSDGSGTAAWTYDLAGHILAERRTIAGITKTISYAYNLDGSISTVTYPSGRQVAYTVNNAQRLTSAKDPGTGTQYAIIASYNPTGAL